MMHRFCFEALDCSLQELMRNSQRFGGKVIVFRGDFRQVLPVVQSGCRDQIVKASLSARPGGGKSQSCG